MKKITLQKITEKIIKSFYMPSLWYYQRIFKPLIIRDNTTDKSIFRNIFLFRELALPIEINPKLIIDAGAYTGLSTLYYSRKFPQAKIFAVEPEDSNFKILEKHTVGNPNISRINAGLWHKEAYLQIIDRHTGHWGFMVKEVGSNDKYNVKAITVDSILKQSGLDIIDILKLDIEGSEKELFSQNFSSWLDKTNIIVIELHNKIKPECEATFYAAFNKADWNEYRQGEKVIMIRKNMLKNT